MDKSITSIFAIGQQKQLVLPHTIASLSELLNFGIRAMVTLKLVFSSIHLLSRIAQDTTLILLLDEPPPQSFRCGATRRVMPRSSRTCADNP